MRVTVTQEENTREYCYDFMMYELFRHRLMDQLFKGLPD